MLAKRLFFSLFFILSCCCAFSDQALFLVLPEIKQVSDEGFSLGEDASEVVAVDNRVTTIYHSIYSVLMSLYHRQSRVSFNRVDLAVDSYNSYLSIDSFFYSSFENYEKKDFTQLLSLAGLYKVVEEVEEEEAEGKDGSAEASETKAEEPVEKTEAEIAEEKRLAAEKAEKEAEQLRIKQEELAKLRADGLRDLGYFLRVLPEFKKAFDGEKEYLDEDGSELAESSLLIIPVVKGIREKVEFKKYYTCFIDVELLIYDLRESPFVTSISFSSAGLSEDEGIAYRNAFADLSRHLQYFFSGGGFVTSSGLILDYMRNKEIIVHLGKADNIYSGQFLELTKSTYNAEDDSVSEDIYGRLQVLDVGEQISFCKLLYSERPVSIGDYVVPVKSVGFNFDISMGMGLFFYRSGDIFPGEDPLSEPVGSISAKISTDRGLNSFRPYLGFDLFFDSPTADEGIPFLMRLESRSRNDIFSLNFDENDVMVANLFAGFMFDYYFNRFSLSTGFGLGLGFVPSKGIPDDTSLKFVPIKADLVFTYFPISNVGVFLNGSFTYHTPLYDVKPWSVPMALNVTIGARLKY
ncbi:MAG: hypothetical protein JXR63_04345 [Spirochaetales bacterium]|nr:hypothetical protein [Spirochaetales bacterium]